MPKIEMLSWASVILYLVVIQVDVVNDDWGCVWVDGTAGAEEESIPASAQNDPLPLETLRVEHASPRLVVDQAGVVGNVQLPVMTTKACPVFNISWKRCKLYLLQEAKERFASPN